MRCVMTFRTLVFVLIAYAVGFAEDRQLTSYYMSCRDEKNSGVSVGATFLFEKDVPDLEFRREWITPESRILRCGYRRGTWLMAEFNALAAEYENCWNSISNGLSPHACASGSQSEGRCKVALSRFAEDTFCSLETNCSVKACAAAMACLTGMTEPSRADNLCREGNVMCVQTIQNDKVPLEVSYVDVYYTRLLYWRRLIRVHGVLEDFGYGNAEHYGLKGPLGIMHSEDHLVHYMKQPRIWLSLDDKERMKCRGLVGKDVVVEGRLSLRGDESNVSHELESLSVSLAQCRILQDDSLGGTLINNDPVCEFTSPCREFKIKVRMLDDKEYHVHCYSSTLWMARVEKDGQVYAQSPWSLYAVARNGVQRSVWASLGRVEAVLADKYKEDSIRAGVCKARPYSKIADMSCAAVDNQELASIILGLFDLLDQERRR